MDDDVKKCESIAIIMDGNRRWAKEKNLPKMLGHKKGAEVLESTVRYCSKIGIKYLTVYAFSTENWKRTEEEVKSIMSILSAYLDRFLKTADLENIQFKTLGDIDNIPQALSKKMKELESRTKENTGMKFNVCFNYGGRAEITRATKLIAEKVKNGELNIEDINEDTISNNLYTAGQKDPDLVIRTSGEMRLSNFLPWQSTYSELLFLKKYWPDFTEKDVDEALEEFANRNRRLGK